MKKLEYIFAVVCVSVLSSLWNGYALSILWRWFVVPLFGAPALGLGYAIGLSLIATFLTHQNSATKSDPNEWARLLRLAICYNAIRPVITLAAGWLVTRYIT